MLNLGLPEILIIAAIAVLVVPPKDLPGLMRTAGRGVGKVRRMWFDFQRELDKATRIDELRDIKKQVADIRQQTEAQFTKDMLVPGSRERYTRSADKALESGANAKPEARIAEPAAEETAPKSETVTRKDAPGPIEPPDKASSDNVEDKEKAPSRN